ncbi:hypothetical protein PG996_007758 [Apiospora saccharicola]|uniref:Altered inheritance of mitochondria protein 21 n=1 Tax=Apiospora saccharicola TaxID=335842 RepID=A0ABR1VEB2_9PEZI
MAGKHDSATVTATSTEPSWRPFAQKLSGFMRHGSTKNRKVSPSQPVQNVGDIDRRDLDRRSVFNLGRNNSYKAPSATETTFEFKPLEVDLSKLENMRLAEGWLEQRPPTPKKPAPDPEQLKKKPLPKPPPSSSTPIADLFASKAEFDSGLSLSTRRHTHLFLDRAAGAASGSGGSSTTSNDALTIARKPVPTSPAPTTTTTTKTTTTTEPAKQPPATVHQATYSILERGRPIEPKDVIPAEPVAALPNESSASIAQKRRSLQSSQSNAGPNTSWSSASKPATVDNRHTMFAAPVAASTTGRIEAGERPTTQSAAANPLDRIQAWQKSITSAPMAPPPSNALGTPQASAPVRKVSPRGLAGNRLAWIRELEEKKSNDLRKDIGVLKKQAGGVSSKLAMFENKGGSSAAPPTSIPRGLPPLSRSNSTTSRMSSVGLKSTTTNQDNATVTPRTSIDTTQSSVHRNSGVMSYYDDSFREKMEGLVSQLAEKDDDKDKATAAAPRKRRITASFVSVEGGRKAAQAMAAAMLSGEKPQVVADSDAKSEEEKKESVEVEPVVAAAAQEEEASIKAGEVAEPTPAAVEPEQEVEAPVVVEAEKVEEEAAAPAEVEEVAAAETPVKAEVEAQPEVAAPEVAEEKVAEEVPAQEEPVVAQPEPEVAFEQSEPVVEAVVAEPVVVEQEKEEKIAAAVEVSLPESDDDDTATIADEKSNYVESVFEDAVEDQQAKIDI